MATHPAIMKARLKAIGELAHSFSSRRVDPNLPDRDRFFRIGQQDVADELRTILGTMPKGVNLIEQSVRRRAKALFIQHHTHKITKTWKGLPEDQKAVWDDYIVRGVKYEEIRQVQP